MSAARSRAAQRARADRGARSRSGSGSTGGSATSRSRSPLRQLRYTAKLFATESFDAHLSRHAARVRDRATRCPSSSASLVGFWLGFDRLSGDTLEPMIVSLYAIPKLTLYPILLLAFGLGAVGEGRLRRDPRRDPDHPVHAVRRAQHEADPDQDRARAKLSRSQMVRWILFPAAIPEIFTGLRVGFALTLIGSLLAEMFASQRGLGYLLMNGIGLHNVELIMAVTLVIVVFAAAVSSSALHRPPAAPARVVLPL